MATVFATMEAIAMPTASASCIAAPPEPNRSEKTDVGVRNLSHKSGYRVGTRLQTRGVMTRQTRLVTGSKIRHQDRDARLEHNPGCFRTW